MEDLKPRLIFVIFISTICFLFITCEFQQNLKSEEIFLDRTTYQMKYKSDWIIDSTDADYDIDHLFTLKPSLEDGSIVFFIFNDSISEQRHVDAQIKAKLKGNMKDGIVTRFKKWGQYQGTGAIVTGKLKGIYKSEVKIFAYTTDTSGFLMVYQILERSRKNYLPTMKLIENTFKLK